MRIAGKINQQIPQKTVYQPGLQTFFAGFQVLGHLLKSDFQFIQTFMPRFIHTWRLTGRAD